MQLMILILFLGLFAHDSTLPAGDEPPPPPIADAATMASLVLAPKLVIAIFYWLTCLMARRRLAATGAHHRLRRLDLTTVLTRYITIILFKADLFALGALLWVRQYMGDLVLADELIVMLPTLGLTAWTWWAYYPVDRALRESSLIGKLDQGQPVHIWTRGQFMLSQLRHQWALMGVPLLIMWAWFESVTFIAEARRLSGDAQAGAMLAGTAVVFLFTPVLIRHVWDTVPLPAGELRDKLVGMCRRYKVRVRELLLWRTFGGMINGAVMGVVGPFRYIMLTDALLEQMKARQIEAVMAHELAHVRKHHIFWLMLVAIGSLELLRIGFTAGVSFGFDVLSGSGLSAAAPASWQHEFREPSAQTLEWSGVVLALIGWFIVFGWVSRRFERQADTFAVQHLARQRLDEAIRQGQRQDHDASLEADAGRGRITHDDAGVMVDALERVRVLNHMPNDRTRWWQVFAMGNWRHGAMPWRQQYLRGLAGQPVDAPAIDRQVFWIKAAAAAGVGLLIALGATGYIAA